jgi:uncharacterized protein YoxC
MTLTKEQVQELSGELIASSLFPSNLDLSIKRVEDRFHQIAAQLSLLDTEAQGIQELLKHINEDLFNQTSTIDTLTQRVALMIATVLQATQ